MSYTGCADPPSLAPPAGHVIGTPAPLVSAISNETIDALRARWGSDTHTHAHTHTYTHVYTHTHMRRER